MKTRLGIRDISPSTPPHHGDSTNEETVILSVHVVPRAARNEIVSVEGETLKIRVTAPPVKGKANQALVELLAENLGVRKNQIEIVSGHKARRKMVKVESVDENAVLALFQQRKEKS
jgi:uncharacterized protein (TIGR00251 family)